jgi:hypothetical protein
MGESMHKSRRWITLSLAALLLMTAATSAFASGIFIRTGGAIEMAARELRFGAEELEAVICSVTLNGSLMSGSLTGAENTEIEVGNVTRTTTRECRAQGGGGGNASFLTPPLPLHARWRNGPGAGQITWTIGIDMRYLRWINNNTASCLYWDVARGEVVVTTNPATISAMTLPTQLMGLSVGPEPPCPRNDRIGGAWSISPSITLQRF